MSTREDELDRLWSTTPATPPAGGDFDAMFDAASPPSDPRDPLGIMPPERFDPKAVRAQTDALAQGATLGWSDELKALVKSLPALLPGGQSPVDAFAQNLKVGEDALREERSAHPGAFAATELAGAALPAILSGGTAAVGALGEGQGAVQAAARAAGAGAKIGAVAGAGSADGGLADRFKGGLLGAGLGALFGGGASAGGRALRGAGRAAVDVAGIRAPAEGAGTIAQRSAAKVLPIDSHGERADELVLQALQRDRIPLDELERRASERGRGEMLLDMGGENVRGLARAAQSIPGEGKEQIATTLQRRSEGEPVRVAQALERGLGVKRQDIVQTAEEIIARRRAQANQLYARAYQAGDVRDPAVLQQMMEKGVKYRPGQIADEGIVQAMKLPQFRKAYDVARRIAVADGEPLPAVWKAVGQGDERRLVLDGYPTVRGLDLMKRGLDDVIERGMRSGKMGRAEARALRNRLDAMLGQLDTLVPEYREARQAFAGESKLLDALQLGKDAMKADPRQTVRQVAAMTEGEQEMLRLGVVDAVRERIDRAADGRSAVRAIFGNEDQRMKLRAVFPSEEAFQRFAAAMEKEATKRETTTAVLVGSRTAPLAAEMADASLDAVKNTAAAASGGLPGLLSAVLNSSAMQAIRGQTEATMNEVTPRLLAGARSGDEIAELLNRLRLRSQRKAVGSGVGRALERGAAAEAGILSGGAQ